MKKLKALILSFVTLFPIFAMIASASAADSTVHEKIIVSYAFPPEDNSMSNPHYKLLSFHWYATINYWVNPKNSYGFSTSAIMTAITASTNTWDAETSFQVFKYRGMTYRTAGRRDGYNVVSWGYYYRYGVIAVT